MARVANWPLGRRKKVREDRASRGACIEEVRGTARTRWDARSALGAYDLHSLKNQRGWIETKPGHVEFDIWYADGDRIFPHRDKDWTVLHLPREEASADRSTFSKVLRRGIETVRGHTRSARSERFKLKFNGFHFIGPCDLSDFLPQDADVSFSECTFDRLTCSAGLALQHLEFNDCRIDEIVEFKDITLQRGLMVRDCLLNSPVTLERISIVHGSMRLADALLPRGLTIRDCDFWGDLQIERCVIGDERRTGSLKVTGSKFERGFQLTHSVVICTASIEQTAIGGDILVADCDVFGVFSYQRNSEAETLKFSSCRFFESVALTKMPQMKSVVLRDCCCFRKFEISVHGIDSFLVEDSAFLGDLVLEGSGRSEIRSLELKDTFFWSNAVLSGLNFLRPLAIMRCDFFCRLALASSTVSAGMDLVQSQFLFFERGKKRRLRAIVSKEGGPFRRLGQNAYALARATLEGNGSDADVCGDIDYERLSADFRTLRTFAQTRQSSRDVCNFYVLENEAHRRALGGWSWNSLRRAARLFQRRGGAGTVRRDLDRLGHVENFFQRLILWSFGLISKYGTSVWRPMFWLLIVQATVATLFFRLDPANVPFGLRVVEALDQAFSLIMPPLGLDVTDVSVDALLQNYYGLVVMVAMDRILTLVLVVLAVLAVKRRMQLG